MAKREPVLKWEHEIADCHAGPFIVTQHAWDFGVIIELDGHREELGLHWRRRTKAACKRLCERLARKIIAATKRGRKHGK